MLNKFFSLICATLLVFSANAAPVAPKAELAKKAPVAVEQMQKVQFERAQVANFNQFSAAPALKVINPKAQAPALRGRQAVRANHAAANNLAAQRRSVAPRKSYSSTYNYKCGPTEVVVTDLSTPTYNQFKLVITQKAKNTAEYPKQTLYDNTVELILDPEEHSIVGTFTSDDYSMDANTSVTSGSNTRMLSYWEPSTITIVSKGGNKYAITDGLLQVENGNGSYLYKYNYCYDVDDLNDQTAEKTPFEFTFGENPEPQPSQDSIVTAVSWQYNDYYYDVYLQSENDVYLFELLESTGGLTYGTTYTYADMYADWVCTLDEEGYPLVKATDATLTVTKDQDGLVHVAATMVLDGVKHVISYDEAPFVPSGVQIPLNGTELSGKYNSYYGMYIYTAKVGENEIQLAFDATEELATYTKDQFLADYSYYASPDYSTYVEFVKAASDFTVTTTETTKTLTGSLYADNGDEYIINLVYEKPAAKEINIYLENATLTNRIAGGFWTIDGATNDGNNSFMIYFISKGLQGTWTDVTKFYSYNTWVSDKSSGSNVYYENISEVNLVSQVINDSLKITGTLSLADSKGNPANVTVYITTPFDQEWGEWADFAPFGLNTGKYYFTLFGEAQTKAAVQVRKDNTGLKQYKITNWGASMFTANGVELVINVDADNVCTLNPTYTGYAQDPYYAITDYDTFTASAQGTSTFDPENGKFTFKAVYFNGSTGQGLYSTIDSLVMNKPISERDTVHVTSTMSILADQAKGIIKVSTEYEGFTYTFEIVGADTVGTFSLADGTLSQQYYYGILSNDGTVRSDFAEGEVTITKDDAGYYLTGLMIGTDEKAYVFDLTKPAGVIYLDTDAPFDATFAYNDMSASIENGVIGIYVTNAENLTIVLELYTDPACTTIPEGTYVISDSQEAGTALKSVGVSNNLLTECWAGVRGTSGITDCWFMVDGIVTLSYDEYGKLKVEIDAENSWGQPVKALVQYVKIEPKDIVEINNAEFYIYEGYIEEYGIMNFYGGNADGYEFDLYAFTDTFAGDFINDVDFGDCELTLADGSHVGIMDADEFKIVADGKNLTLTAKVLGKDTVQYNITATGYIGALEYDAKDAYYGDFTMEAVTLTQATETMVQIVGINAAGDSINLVVEGELVSGVLAAGEYTNILVSPGVYNYNFTPSFILNEEAVWFIQSGKLTVANNGSMTFEGFNSYDKTVTITITVSDGPSGLLNVKTNATAVKFFRNGRLMIVRDGKKYNALGM